MIGRGLLVVLVAFVGASLMLASAMGRLGAFSIESFETVALLATGPAFAAFWFHELMLTGHPAARVAFMVLSTFVGIIFASVWVLVWGLVPITSFWGAIAALVYAGPLIFYFMLVAVPWSILIWAACAFATLKMGGVWSKPQPVTSKV